MPLLKFQGAVWLVGAFKQGPQTQENGNLWSQLLSARAGAPRQGAFESSPGILRPVDHSHSVLCRWYKWGLHSRSDINSLWFCGHMDSTHSAAAFLQEVCPATLMVYLNLMTITLSKLLSVGSKRHVFLKKQKASLSKNTYHWPGRSEFVAITLNPTPLNSMVLFISSESQLPNL